MTLREIKNKTINKTKVAMFVLSSSLLLTSCGKANIDEPIEEKNEETIGILEDEAILVEEMPEQVIDEPVVEEPEEMDKEIEQEYYSYYIDLSNYVGDNLTEALKENGYEYSFNFRKSIAKDLMIPNYVGTQVQNLAILALCGGSLTITDEDLIKEVDELIEQCLRNIGLGYIKEEKTTKRKNKNESVDATAYKIVPVEPEKIPTTTNWTSSLGDNSPTYNTGNNDNSNNSDNNNNNDNNNDNKDDNKDNKKKHKHKYIVTISYESNKDGKTHKKIETKKCKDNDSTIVKVLVEKEPCTETVMKQEGEYECGYCGSCNQLLRKVKKHNHKFTEIETCISNKDGKTHTVKATKKCACGHEETYIKNPGEACTEGQAKREGNYDNYYCTKCGQLLRQVKVEEDHKHKFTETETCISNKDGKTHTVKATKKCACGHEETYIKNPGEACTEGQAKREGNYDNYYCTKCGQLLRQVKVEEEKKHNHNWVKDSTISNNDGTHTVTYKCTSTIGKCDQPTKTETESCTHHHTGKIGCEEFYYCSCGYKMESLGVNHTSGAPETSYTGDANSYCYKVVVRCSNCGAVLNEETIGHSFPEGRPGETVSCTNGGCGATKKMPGEPTPPQDPEPDPKPIPNPDPEEPINPPIPTPDPDPEPDPEPIPDPDPEEPMSIDDITLEEYWDAYVTDVKNLAIRTINNQKRDYIYYKNTLEILLDKRKYLASNYILNRKRR